MKFTAVAALAASIASASAYTVTFKNQCSYAVWPAMGKAPNGAVDPSFAYGAKLNPGESITWGVDNYALGIRGWGRTGCDANGANCATGACNGGMVCNDAGITAHALYSEYGYGDAGQWGGQRTYWDLSFVGGNVNIPGRLSSTDGASTTCTSNSCPTDQAYHIDSDHAAMRSSSISDNLTHTFCP
ncbi:thaumatin [Schizophyllum amplum]|uniref:Thaumatin n=1 Tax=Schizophyllum amplum TaxID=97359 RepID=A0A550CLX6_9AGAR|nr:thaumatin [Auriculariopsis ampla]